MIENFTRITDQLWVGEAPNKHRIEEFAKIGISAFIDLRSEDCDDQVFLNHLGIDFLHVDIDDTYPPTMDQLMEILQFADPILDAGRNILVHCQNGYGRSPLIVAAILIHRGMSTEEALKLLYQRHPLTTLMHKQEVFIRSLEEQLMKI